MNNQVFNFLIIKYQQKNIDQILQTSRLKIIYRDIKLKEAQKSLAGKKAYWLTMTTRNFLQLFFNSNYPNYQTFSARPIYEDCGTMFVTQSYHFSDDI